ncbi:MAG: DUF4835 family protein [Flavobacteriaceae bacterium]
MKIKLLLLFIFLGSKLFAQDLNAEVSVNYDRISATSNEVFNNLEQAMSNFLNQTKWSDKNLTLDQRLKCQVSFIVTDVKDFTSFSGILQVQGSRPVFGSSYQTTLLNFRDTEISFSFTEFQALNYNENSLNNNLEAVLSYYAYLMLGLEAESFESGSGDAFFAKAEERMSLAQQSGYSGWANRPSDFNRYSLIKSLRSPSQSWFLELWYDYHRNGLDQLYHTVPGYPLFDEDLSLIDTQARSSYNNFLKRLFFDCKMDELVGIYNEAPSLTRQEVVVILGRQASSYQDRWSVLTQ